MKVYPVFLNIVDKPCLVAGGGAVGERKVEDLLAAGAQVTVVSPQLTPTLKAIWQQGIIRYLEEDFSPAQLEGMALVIGATDDPELNRRISVAAQERGLPVNIVDAPALCSFVVPATIRRGELTIAIGTGGLSPALAKKLRQELEQYFRPEYGPYLQLLGAIRERVLARRRDHPDNLALFTRLVNSRLRECLMAKEQEQARQIMQEILSPVLPAEDLVSLQSLSLSLSRS